MLAKKVITGVYKLEANKKEYKLKYNEVEVLNGSHLLGLFIRPSDSAGHRKATSNLDIVSDETLLAGHITLRSKSKELIKDLPLEMVLYRPEGNMVFYTNVENLNLTDSKINLQDIAAEDVGKSIEVTFIYS